MKERHEGLRAAWPLGVVLGAVLVLTLPFVGKAVHIDDVYFIEVARNILADPLRPFAGAVALEDGDYRVFAAKHECPNTFESMSHPPLVPYALALIAKLTGSFAERGLHLGFTLFALGAALAMYSLAKRFTQHSLGTTLLLVSSPIFIVSAHGLMTDMPTLALGLGGLALFIQGIDQERRGKVLAAGLLVALAVMTRYAALLSVVVLLAYGFARGRLRKSLPALIGLGLILSGWAAQNLIFHGELHIVASSRHYRAFYAEQSFDWLALVKQTLADLAALGGTAFLAALFPFAAGAGRRAVAFGAGVWAAAMVFVVRPTGMERLETYATLDIMAVAGCFGCGLVLLTEVLWPEPGRAHPLAPAPPAAPVVGDGAFLVLWLLLALAGALVFLPFGTARYMLPALPPLWLLWARRAEAAYGARRVRHVVLALVVGQGVLLGALLALADADHAERYRDVARSLRANQPDKTLWFVGEWGFRHYMEAVGGRYLSSADNRPQTGDLIVRPFIAGMHVLSADVRSRAVLIQSIPLESRWPIRLMNFDAKAGYYSHHWGYLPWAPSHAPLEQIEIFEIRAPAPKAPVDACPAS